MGHLDGLPSPRISEPATKAHSASGNFAVTNRWAMFVVTHAAVANEALAHHISGRRMR
jgi:hypothetical protein